MPNANIKTYSPENFRDRFIQPGQLPDTLLKANFGKFFVVKVEEMIRLMKLPVPPARTTNHTLIYLTEGEAVMTIGSETYKIFQDECLVVPAGQVFSFDKVDLNRGYLCNFHPDFPVGRFGSKDVLKEFEFLNVWGNPHIRLDPQTSVYVRQLLNRILRAYSEEGLHPLSLLQSYFIALLNEIDRVYRPLSGSSQTAAVSLTNRFKELLFANITSRHRVTDYAALLHITPNHLNKSVKAITGKSPTKWIDETLVLEAKVLLYQSDLTISEIAARIGLYDPSYFSRLFKKYEGQTPLEFRKMIETS